MKNLTTLTAAGILLAYMIIMWRLDLREGTPRILAALGLLVLFIGMYLWARRAYDKS